MANFTLTFQQIAGGADFAPIVGVSDLYEYKDGNRTSTRLGSRYTILILSDGCSSLGVRVEDAEAPVISQEELDKHAALKASQHVRMLTAPVVCS